MALNPFDIKKTMIGQKEEALAQFKSGDIDVQTLTHTFSDIVDEHVAMFADEYLGEFKDKIALVYTGSNGRRETCPHSDLDVFMLLEDDFFDGKALPEDIHESYSKFLNALTDIRLLDDGLKPRNVQNCEEEILNDQEVWTQMIDRRLAWGSEDLYARMDGKVAQIDDSLRPNFIQDKFDEYDQRVKKPKNAPYSTVNQGVDLGGRYAVVEPNVKDGYGGLRAIQTARWVESEHAGAGADHGVMGNGVTTQDDENAAQQAYNFILSTRCHLHDIAGKEDDILRAHYQPELVSRMGYDDVESFMKDYIAATQESAHYAKMVCADVAEQLGIKPPGDISDTKINFKNGEVTHPAQILELFKQHAQTGHSLHHGAMHAVRQNTDLLNDDFIQDPDANRMMLDILSHDSAARTLHRMNNLGVLGKFVPEFDPVVHLTQFDPYHAYTVDDHTIVAIGNIASLVKQEHAELSPVASEIAEELTQSDREILSVALLLHDVHKSESPDNMKDYNRDLVERVGKRLGLEGDALNTAAWLAENHLLLKHTSRYHDIEAPETIEDFVSKLPDVKHLDLLRVMTFADTLALGPGRLSPHAAYRSDSLYERAHANITGLSSHYNQQAFVLPDDYEQGKPYVSIRPNQAINADVLTVITQNKPYLLENIMAALEKTSGTVLNARVRTIANGSDRAMNSFVIQNNQGGMHFEGQIKTIQAAVLDAVALDERIEPSSTSIKSKLIKNPQNNVFSVAPTIEFTNALSDSSTTIQITARDRPNLLYDITSAFNDLELNLCHASIMTKGHRAVNVFEVHTDDGSQVSPDEQEAIHDALMECVSS